MIFSTPREFTPATKETGLSDATPLWFIFKKNELLVLQKDVSKGLEIPNLKDPSELGFQDRVPTERPVWETVWQTGDTEGCT